MNRLAAADMSIEEIEIKEGERQRKKKRRRKREKSEKEKERERKRRKRKRRREKKTNRGKCVNIPDRFLSARDHEKWAFNQSIKNGDKKKLEWQSINIPIKNKETDYTLHCIEIQNSKRGTGAKQQREGGKHTHTHTHTHTHHTHITKH